MLLPLMAAIVRRSAWRGSKSVEARTISSPTFQPLASSTWIEVAPALAVADSLLQVLVVEPCRFRVPPAIMMPRSPMPTMTSSPLTLSVRVMVALRVWGLAAVPMANSPWSMIHSVVSSRSALLEKLSLPSMDRPPRAGGLTSSTTSLSLPMTTLSPAAGTFLFGQVAGSDQFVARTDCVLTSWVVRTAMALTTRRAGTSDKGRNERFFSLLIHQHLSEDDSGRPSLAAEDSPRAQRISTRSCSAPDGVAFSEREEGIRARRVPIGYRRGTSGSGRNCTAVR